MASTKITAPGPKSRSALDTAKWAVPLVLAAGRWLAGHPELMDRVKEQLETLKRSRTSTPAGALETIEVLRGNVGYLAASADDEAEQERAARWAKQLDHCEQAARLVQAPGATRKDRRALKARVDALRSEIVAAFIQEQGEDAQEADAAAE